MLPRPLILGLILAAAPLLAACTQTATPAAPGVPGAEALAAISDVQAGNAAVMTSVAVSGHIAGLDPTRTAGMISGQVLNHQMNVQNEKNRRMLDEMMKLGEEAPKLEAQLRAHEREQAAKKGAQRKPNQEAGGK